MCSTLCCMPDTRKHRGPHPADADLFAPAMWPALRLAVVHSSWLLTRGYPVASSLKLVGDRFQLTERQRTAVLRSACSDEAREHRAGSRLNRSRIAGETLHIDGFNVLTTIEAALAGGVILRGRDGCDRDMASMHGNYRKVDETAPALLLIGNAMADWRVAGACWLLDRPVSNSGRLRGMIRKIAAERGWNWEVELVDDPDKILVNSTAVVASADSAVLDRCSRWFNLAHEVVRDRIADANIVPLDGDAVTEITPRKQGFREGETR